VTRKIRVDHLSRVEGHGRIKVEIADGKITELQFSLFEGPRFFEAVALGTKYDQVHSVMARICAICSAGHKITSIMALEDALGVEVTEQTKLLRELYYHGMFIESHVLHLYFLALPDYLGYPSAIAMVSDHGPVVERALQMKKLANDIQEVCSGRPIHGENPVVGGFGQVPSADQLRTLHDRLQEYLPAAEETVSLFAGLDYPSFTKAPTVFYAVKPDGDLFSYFGSSIACSDGRVIAMKDYRQVCEEKVLPYTSAKQSLPGGQPFMVGALARVNLFASTLTPRAARALEQSGISIPSDNSLHNNLAQAVETLYSFERAIDIIEDLFRRGLKQEPPVEVRPKAGVGIAGTEVPRGTLYHEYELDDEGRVVKANVVTPTAQNQANIEKDFRNCVTRMHEEADDVQLTKYLEMIARAYDPCISCAAHYVELVRR